MKPVSEKNAEIKQGEAQDLARIIFANPNPILQFSEKGALLFSNQAGKDFLQLCDGDSKNALGEEAVHISREAMAGQTRNAMERECGQKIYSFNTVSVPETGDVIFYGKDITEQRKFERALEERENELKTLRQRLLRHEEYRRSLFDQMNEGFALYEVIEDEDGAPIDYRFLEVNGAYEKLTGLKREHVLHKLHAAIPGGADPEFVKISAEVMRSGVPARFVDYSKTLERYFDILAFKLGEKRVAILFSDITVQKQEDAAKNNFIAIMAHELRNPLMPIFTNTELLNAYLSKNARQGRKVDSQIKESVDIISRQANTLGKLLDDLLDISRIIRGKTTLNRRPVDLCQSIRHAIEMTKPLMESQKHAFSFSFPSSPVYINADPIRIEQVVTNLLNNAAKYTKPGGHISLAVAATVNGTVLIKVWDTGIGIKPQDINKIFELFMQFSKPFVETQGDIGIGLKIIKDIVLLHNGTINVKSDGVNQGSEFTVSLPTIPAPIDAEFTAKTETLEQPPHLLKRKILLVDDNNDISSSLKLLLAHCGHDVRVASDGKSAIAAAESFMPELVLLDIGLPDMTGYEVARRLREKHGETFKLVALTGYGQEKDKILSKEAGFDYHMTKPISIQSINQTIKRCFQ
jgi:signal transduction histidine kinase